MSRRPSYGREKRGIDVSKPNVPAPATGGKDKKRVALGNMTNMNVPGRASVGPGKMDISDEEEPLQNEFGAEAHLPQFLMEEVDHDPQSCGEFVEDIYTFLHESQRKYLPPDFLQIQTDITAVMLGILMDWLVEVAEEYHLNNETLHLSKHYIDRFLSIYKVPRARLQLVGVAAMLVAAKFEEIFPPSVDDFVYISDNTFSRAQVIEMESLVLNSLRFDLTNPTGVDFLQRYTSICKADISVVTLSKFLMELTLMDYSMIGFLPSHVALASLMLASHAQLLQPALHRSLHRFVVESERVVLAQCMANIHRLWVNVPKNKLQAVRLKYERTKNHKVAQIPPSTTLPIF